MIIDDETNYRKIKNEMFETVCEKFKFFLQDLEKIMNGNKIDYNVDANKDSIYISNSKNKVRIIAEIILLREDKKDNELSRRDFAIKYYIDNQGWVQVCESFLLLDAEKIIFGLLK